MPSYHLPPGVQFQQDLDTQARAITLLSWSPDGEILASTTHKQSTILWKWPTGEKVDTSATTFSSMVWSPDGGTLACIANDGEVARWSKHTGWKVGTEVIYGYSGEIYSDDGCLFTYQVRSNEIIFISKQQRPREHYLRFQAFGTIQELLFSPNQQMLAGILGTGTIAAWKSPLEQKTSPDPVILQKQLDGASGLAWSPDARVLAVYGMQDDTILLLNAVEQKEKRLLKGHTDRVISVAFSPDGKLLASKSLDGVLLFWRTDTWETVATATNMFVGDETGGLVFHPKMPVLAVYGSERDFSDDRGIIRLLKLDGELLLQSQPSDTVVHFYKNAKVVLVGESGVGKSGLSLVLTGQPFAPTESTHGRHVWTFESSEMLLADGKSEAREILLWDLAGQPGYRLIHQLHLNEVSTALIVSDTQRETDPFAGVYHWVRALNVAQRSSSLPMRKILVQARIDRGGISASRERIETLVQELGLDGHIETSAKEDLGIAELQQMIRDSIDWDALPKVSSTPTFQKINAFLLSEKESGRVLSTLDEIYQAFLRATRELRQRERLREHFETCIDQIESQGLVRKLSFGNLILLQPELLDIYASALVNAVRDEPDGLGSLAEEDIRAGGFFVPSDQRLANKEQEKLLLIAMIEDLLRSEVALRERAENGPYLVFPSQSTRENPDLPDPEEKAVIFRFEGPLQNIYATLAVRLAHSGLFKLQALWRDAVTYTTSIEIGTCGMFLRNFGEGRGELTLFFEHGVGKSIRAVFEEYVHVHLQQRSLPESVRRQPIIRCHNCGTPFTTMQIERRLQRGFNSITCSTCDEIALLVENDDELLARKARTTISEMDRIADVQREREIIDSTHANRWSIVEDVMRGTLVDLFQEVGNIQVEIHPGGIHPGNPYYEYGAVRDLEDFFGRREPLENVYRAVSKHQSISLIGLPRIGKSSFLKYLQLPEVQVKCGYNLQNMLFIWLDMKDFSFSTAERFFSSISEKIIEQSHGKFKPAQSDNTSQKIFDHLLHQISQNGYYLVLLMDEFDSIKENMAFDERFFSYLRSMAGVQDLVSYVTASIEPLYKLAPLSKAQTSPFFNIFASCNLGPLTLAEARDLITIPARRAHLPFVEIEINWALKQAGRHPFFLQRVCQHLFDQKMSHPNTLLTQEELNHVQELTYQELLPHFDNQWSYLSAKEQELLGSEALSNNNPQRKFPELSESSLFRRFVREKHQVLLSQMSVEELQGILNHLNDTTFLGQCTLASWSIIDANADVSSSLTKKGKIVREVLQEAFEQLKGLGVRSDTSQDWRLYNIFYYDYIKYHLPHQQTAARLSISARQYYRERNRALQALLNVLLEMEHTSLSKI